MPYKTSESVEASLDTYSLKHKAAPCPNIPRFTVPQETRLTNQQHPTGTGLDVFFDHLLSSAKDFDHITLIRVCI